MVSVISFWFTLSHDFSCFTNVVRSFKVKLVFRFNTSKTENSPLIGIVCVMPFFQSLLSFFFRNSLSLAVRVLEKCPV